MIHWVILIAALAFVYVVAYAHWVNRRARRQRRSLRHITGIEEWWGKR